MKSCYIILIFHMFIISVSAGDITSKILNKMAGEGETGIYRIMNPCFDLRRLFLASDAIEISINENQCIIDYGRGTSDPRYTLNENTTLRDIFTATQINDENMLSYLQRTKVQIKVIQQNTIMQSELGKFPSDSLLNTKLRPGDIVVCIYSLPY